jgi:hypothetical protein
MGKTRFSKLEDVSRSLKLNSRDPKMLVALIVSEFLKAEKHGVQLNVISNQVVIDVLFELSKISLSSTNFAIYKRFGIDITLAVAEGLSIPICNSSKCKITLSNGRLKIEPIDDGPIAAFHTLLDKSPGSDNIQAYYGIWANNGWKVGDRRNWVQPNLIAKLQKYNVRPAVPISHSLPTQLHRLFKKLTNLVDQAESECLIGQSISNLIDDKILDFCNSEILNKMKRKHSLLLQDPNLPPIKFVDEVEAQDRLTPYLYCRMISDKIAKVGKDNNSNSRFKKKDRGIVICMKREGDEILSDCERNLLSQLAMRGIHPVGNTYEQFSASYIDLCNVTLDICASIPELRSKIISITSTY